MLLRYKNIEELETEDSMDFFEDNQEEIMQIFSIYSTLGNDEISDEECAMWTIIYLLYGTDEDVPNVQFQFSDEELEEIRPKVTESKFLAEVFDNILYSQVLNSLVKEGLVKASRDKITGKILYKKAK